MQKTFVRGGSVKVFVIVGVILTVLAFTALYFVGKNFYAEQVPPMAVPESLGSDDDQSDKHQAHNSSTDDEGAVSNEQETTDLGSGSVPGATNDQGGSTAGAAGSTDGLPHAGPGDDFGAPVGLVALTVSLASYVGSVRRVRTP